MTTGTEGIKLIVDCVHCGKYEPNEKEQGELPYLPFGGFTCPRCSEECRVRFGARKIRSGAELVIILDRMKGITRL